MQKQLKKWVLLACLTPTLVFAQALSSQRSAAPAPVAAAPIDAEKQAAIKALLTAIDADKLAVAIGNNEQMLSKQLAPAILSDALAENKKLKEEEKRAIVPQLQQNAVPKLVAEAGKVFETPKFREDALKAQTQAYANYYSTQEIRDLTKFYMSATGRKFIQVQDQVGRDVINGLRQNYMPVAIQAIRTQADKEVKAAKPGAVPANKK